MVDRVVDEEGCPGRDLGRLTRDLGGIVISSRPKGRPRLEERGRAEEEARVLLQADQAGGEGGCCGRGCVPLPRDQEGGLASLEGGEITDAAVNAAGYVLAAVRGSSNLKGGHVKIMKDGVAFVMAAVQELAGKVADSEGGARVAALKKKLALARSQIEKLKKGERREEENRASSGNGDGGKGGSAKDGCV